MQRFLLIYCFVFIAIQMSFAQGKKNIEQGFIRFYNDNDYYKMRDGTDQYYTNGFAFEYQPKQNNRNVGIRAIFPKLSSQQMTYTSPRFGLVMQAYTPENAYDTLSQHLSRPFAGLAYFTVSGVSNDVWKGERLTTSYGLGMIGPRTYQGAMQLWFHKISDRKAPKGWNQQIANDLALNANLQYEKGIWNPASPLEFIGLAEANCGSVMNYASLGGLFRLGFMNDYFLNASGLSPKITKRAGKLPSRRIFSENFNRRTQMYFYGKTLGRFVLDNSLLEGGYFNFKNSPYKLTKSETEKFYAQFEFGYVFSTRFFSVSFSQTFRTKEFKTGKSAQWGTVGLTIGI